MLKEVYKDGLKISDLVTYEDKNIVSIKKDLPYIGLVLERKFMFSNQTQWGEKGFFEYKIFVSNKIKKIKTNHMKIISRRSI